MAISASINMAAATPYLLHVTETTGHTRRSPRGEVPDEVIERLRPVLQEALAGPVAVPGCEGYQMRARTDANGLHCQVLSIDGALVSFLVSRGTGGDPPRYLVRLHLDALDLHPGAAEWLGDFELCVAWCWLEGR